MHTRDHGGKSGDVSLAGPGEPGDGHRGGPAALEAMCPFLGVAGTLPRAPRTLPQLMRGGSGHRPGGAAGSGVTRVLPLPKRHPQAPPVPPIPVTVPFSPQHECARGLRARRCHRLHQHQLAEVCGVEAGWESPQHPRGSFPSQLRLSGCTEPPPAAGVPPAPPAPALPNYSLPQHSRPRHFTYFSDPTIIPTPPTPGL